MQILLLAVVTMILVGITTVLVHVLDVVPKGSHEDNTYGWMAWESMIHALDAGTLADDDEGWTYNFIMLFITIGGLFVLSALIGVLNQGFGRLIEGLRRGRSVVIEKRHTVILGWTPKIQTLLTELAIANANKRHACVVILAERDKVDMDADVSSWVGKARMRVVTRTGSPMVAADLEIVSPAASRAVIVLAPNAHPDGEPMASHESDTIVLRTLLALGKVVPPSRLQLVAELRDPRTEGVARMVAGEKAALIVATPLISKLLVQTGRQSGLSVVYTELLDFAGNEIYVRREPKLDGSTFRDAVHRYGTSSLIGVLSNDGKTLVPPALDRIFAEGDRVIAIAEDDDKLVLDGAAQAFDPGVFALSKPHQPLQSDRTLVLGIGARLPSVLAELDSYTAAGSEVVVVGDSTFEAPSLANMKISSRLGDLTDRALLESLDVSSFDHILVLSEASAATQELADARTTVTLLHLRDIASKAGKKVPITSEILDIGSRDLAAVAEADDFIVSNTLISLMLSQIAESPHLVPVFDQLFSADGYEIYLKPAHEYVHPGTHAFAVVAEAALRRNEIAIGYRHADRSMEPTAAFGVTINPPKKRAVTLGADDKVIVLAEN